MFIFLWCLTTINIDSEHICCSISQKKGEFGVDLKKEWLKERIKDGLVFTKLDERGKVFIEYIPGEKAFVPVKADNYMYINCFLGYQENLKEMVLLQNCLIGV